MITKVVFGDFPQIKEKILVKFCRAESFNNDLVLNDLNRRLGGIIENIYDSGEFSGKLNESIILHGSPYNPTGKIVLAGLGTETLSGHDQYRQSAGTISTLTAIKKSDSVAFFLNGTEDAKIIQAIVEGFLLGRYKMLDYKTGEEFGDKLRRLNFYSSDKGLIKQYASYAERGNIISEGVYLARTLAMHPGNMLPPREFARQIQVLAKKHKLNCTILDEKKIHAEKMGALMAVGQGSQEPPRFVIIKYSGGRSKSKPIVLVGKGITFDAGGISLKPALDMGDMKGDMQGAAIVVSTIVTAARLKMPLNLVAIVPMAENMPSGKATRPGDIIKSRRGKTIEIINTDAEGRLILADALDYANNFKPQAVIDIATLTGAAQYILGPVGIPIMGNDIRVLDAFRDASLRCSEKVWELPIWDEYSRMMKSSIADLKNSSGKYAGTLTAAAFLKNFIGNWPWVHVDIAAVDLIKSDMAYVSGRPYLPSGASATGLRLFIEILSNWKEI